MQQELLTARRQLETQSTQILSLEAALAARPVLPPDAQPSEKDRLLEEQKMTIEDLRRALAGFEANLGEPLRKVKEDVEEEFREQISKLEEAKKETDAWAEELVRQLEREKQHRIKLEEEKMALFKFVSDIDSHLGSSMASIKPASKLRKPRVSSFVLPSQKKLLTLQPVSENSPLKLPGKADQSLLDQAFDDEWADTSFDGKEFSNRDKTNSRSILGDLKENMAP